MTTRLTLPLLNVCSGAWTELAHGLTVLFVASLPIRLVTSLSSSFVNYSGAMEVWPLVKKQVAAAAGKRVSDRARHPHFAVGYFIVNDQDKMGGRAIDAISTKSALQTSSCSQSHSQKNQ